MQQKQTKIMKTIQSIIFVLLSALLPSALFATDPVSLKTAFESKLIKVDIHGTAFDMGTPASKRYYGECISFKVENLTSNVLNLKLENGRKLISDYDSIQNMIITHQLVFALNGNETATYKVYGMCIEKNDYAPDSKSTFKFGEIADGYLFQLTQMLEKNNYQDHAGQSAVWAITDHIDTTAIYSDNRSEKNLLRKFIGTYQKATAEKKIVPIYDPEKTTYIERKEYNISGKIDWTMSSNTFASLLVYDEQGNLVSTIFDKRKFDEGEQSYDFKVVSCLIQKGKKYLVRLKIKDITVDELICIAE
jgi:hypothetical protein